MRHAGGLAQTSRATIHSKTPDAAHERQGVVLSLMQKGGFISSQDTATRAASAWSLRPRRSPSPRRTPSCGCKAGLEQLLPPGRLRAGGLHVTTTLDLDWQKRAEEIVSRQLAQLQPCAGPGAPAGTCDPASQPRNARVTDAALVALDPRTGAVLAMVGGPDYFDSSISGAVEMRRWLRASQDRPSSP